MICMISELPALEIINSDGFTFPTGYAFENVTQLVIESRYDK